MNPTLYIIPTALGENWETMPQFHRVLCERPYGEDGYRMYSNGQWETSEYSKTKEGD